MTSDPSTSGEGREAGMELESDSSDEGNPCEGNEH